MEPTCDHLGPGITNSVEDNALLLSVIAGYDNGLDSRQNAMMLHRPVRYHERLMRCSSADLDGVRIGVLDEGFKVPGSMDSVVKTVLQATNIFKDAGATVELTSVPMHSIGQAIWGAVFMESSAEQMWRYNADIGSKGFHMTKLTRHFAEARRQFTQDLSDSAQISFLIGAYVQKKFDGAIVSHDS